jgi:hypothetical protein
MSPVVNLTLTTGLQNVFRIFCIDTPAFLPLLEKRVKRFCFWVTLLNY